MTEYTVEFVGKGETIQVSETEPILTAAVREGISQEFSCRVGMCLACIAEIHEGEVTQPAAHGLSEEETADYALTCVARPETDLRIERGNYPPSIESDAAGTTPADD